VTSLGGLDISCRLERVLERMEMSLMSDSSFDRSSSADSASGQCSEANGHMTPVDGFFDVDNG